MSGFGGSGAVSVVSATTVIGRSLFMNKTFELPSPIPGMDDASAGAVHAIGGLVVRESQFEGNVGFEGGALSSSHTLVPQFVPTAAALPPIQIIGSTFADNEASTAGGAIYALQPLIMSNSTVSGNSGESAGAMNVDGTISLDFCTIVANSSTSSGSAVSANGGVSIFGSIVYDNEAPGEVTDILAAGPVTVTASLVTSFQSVASTPTPAAFDEATFVNQDPILSPLGDYGGFTLPGGTKIQTRAPKVDSPVIDTIELITVGNGDGSTDQRGTGFPRFVNGLADMGAVEFIPVVVPSPPNDTTHPIPDFSDSPWSLNLERQTHLPDTM